MSIRTTPTHFLVLGGLLTATPALSCALFSKSISQAPDMIERSWTIESVFTEQSKNKLDTPSVFVDAQGHPGFALAYRGYIIGTQSTAVGRYTDEGWRVSFPRADAPFRVCGRADGDDVVVTHGPLQDPLTAITWDGTSAKPAEPGFCPERSQTKRSAEGPSGTHVLELSSDKRTLWLEDGGQPPCPPHDVTPGFLIEEFAFAVGSDGAPNVALYERPENDEQAPGHLRHATCQSGAWSSSMIAPQVEVSAVGLALASDGHPHVVYVDESGKAAKLLYATPGEGSASAPKDRDARVRPAIEACERLWSTPPQGEGIAPYQDGDGFRCAVLQHAPETTAQALEYLDSLCSSGTEMGCALAGTLHHWLMGTVSITLEVPTDGGSRFQIEWSGLRANGIEPNDARAAEFFGRACDDGNARACMVQAFVVPGSDPKRLERATMACQAGFASACTLAIATRGGSPTPELAATAEPVLRSACEGDDAPACNTLGVLRHVGGDGAGARTALDRACRSGLQVACDNLGRVPVPQ